MKNLTNFCKTVGNWCESVPASETDKDRMTG